MAEKRSVEKNRAEKSTYSAPALEKGLDILELLAQQPAPLSKNMIAEKLGRNINEIFRMLACLEARGYLRVDEAGGIQLSMRLWQLSHAYPPQDRLRALALPNMQALSEATGQSCHLVLPEESRLLVVARQESPGKMGFSVKLGAQVDLYESTSGWLLLALGSPSLQQQLWQCQPLNPEQKQLIESALPEIRAQRRVVRESMQVRGITNISLPLCNASGDAFAVLTMPYLGAFAANLSETAVSLENAIQACEQAALAIQAQLGY